MDAADPIEDAIAAAPGYPPGTLFPEAADIRRTAAASLCDRRWVEDAGDEAGGLAKVGDVTVPSASCTARSNAVASGSGSSAAYGGGGGSSPGSSAARCVAGLVEVRVDVRAIGDDRG